MKREVILLACLALFTTSNAQTGKPASKPGKVFRDCPTCPEMVVIPAGSFLMGAAENEFENSPFREAQAILERPQHKETIRSFAISKYDVTKKEYAEFVAATHHKPECGCAWAFLPGDTTPWVLNREANWNHMGFPQDSTHPVTCISFQEAHAFVDWLSKKAGKQYRLPSEAEWEYAARAGTTTAFPWGDSTTRGDANYGSDSASGVPYAAGKDKWVFTSPVGSFPPNPWGLYDMHGNVLQWVEDCFSDSYHDYTTDGSPFHSEDTIHTNIAMFSRLNGRKVCSLHMCRGGDFGDQPTLIRSAARNFADVTDDPATNYASSGLTIRLARSL